MNGLDLRIVNLHKTYPGAECPVFNGFCLDIKAGSLCAIIGPSGIGKTTLLNCISGLDHWELGSIYVGEQSIPTNNPEALALYRRKHIGMAFQQPYLMSEFTVEENLLIPFRIIGNVTSQQRNWVANLLTNMGLMHLANRFPETLSSGQAARIGLIRAIVRQPSIWLLDEPTGNLDPTTAKEVFQFLINIHQELRPTTLLVTHNIAIAERCEYIIKL
jgi:putative ABC transport system ATP-binding protein